MDDTIPLYWLFILGCLSMAMSIGVGLLSVIWAVTRDAPDEVVFKMLVVNCILAAIGVIAVSVVYTATIQ